MYGYCKNTVLSVLYTLFLITFLYMIVEYFQSDSGQTTLFYIILGIVFVGIIFVIFVYKNVKAEEEAEKLREQLAGKITHFTKQEFVKGFSKTSDFGWVRTNGEETREQVEKILKVKAAELGANAVIKFSWQSEKETYQAGKGKRGNPYFKNRTVYGGEATAVFLEDLVGSHRDTASKTAKQSEGHSSFNKKPDFKKYLGNKIALDGNNIVGRSGWSFQPLTSFLEELAETTYEYTVFFDNSIYRALRENNLISKGETISTCISRITGLEEKWIVVTPAGVEADPFILEFSVRQKAAVISNDKYADFQEAYPSVFDDNLLKFELVGDTILVPKLNFNS